MALVRKDEELLRSPPPPQSPEIASTYACPNPVEPRGFGSTIRAAQAPRHRES